MGLQVVNVKDYGAKGDGETDDISAIKEAAEVAEEGGGPLYFPPGEYRYTEMPQLLGSRMHLHGAGMGLTVLKPEGCNAFKMSGTDFTARDFQIDGAGVGGGFVFGEGFHALVERIYATDCTGAGFAPDGSGSFNQMIFRGLAAANNAGHGVDASWGSKYANNCEFYALRCWKNEGTGLYTNGSVIRVFGGWFASNAMWGIRVAGIGGHLYAPLVENNFESRNYPREDNTEYAEGARTKSTDTKANPYTFMCVKAGTSGEGEPEWPAVVGETVGDGTCEWLNAGSAGEGNGDGAGIDDREASRMMAWRSERSAQPMLLAGDNVEIYGESSGGGSLRVRNGRSGFGRIGGVILSGSATEGIDGYVTAEGGSGDLASGSDLRVQGLRHLGGNGLGFFGAPKKEKQTVSGSAGGNAALESLLKALAEYGLIADETT
jgi:hypothetical protein